MTAANSEKATYRPDIDALRGVAVLLVVLFHVGLPGIGGGYIGVDVFFVISGYLITHQLLEVANQPLGTAIQGFYERRARRIIPALGVMVLVVLVAGYFILLPTGEQQDLGKSAVATAFFSSNVFFWRTAGDYFAGAMESQPLLHTWSLGVEEQFYFIWPLVILLAARQSRRWLIGSICLLSAVSFAVGLAWLARDPMGAFYNTPGRIWEFGAGGILAVTGVSVATVFAWPGILLVVGSAVLFGATTPFPGIAALLPVAGTVLLIAARRPAIGGSLMVRLGRVSYSWYLWHWPALVFVRDHNVRNKVLVADLLAVAAALGVAIASTHWIENPIRRKVAFRGLRLGTSTALALLTCGLCAASLYVSARKTYRATLAPDSVDCLQRGASDPSCLVSQGHVGTVYLVGDSHADHWSPALAVWARPYGIRVLERSIPGCAALLEVRSESSCGRAGQDLLAELVNANPKPIGVVFSANWENLVGESVPPDIFREKLAHALDSLQHAGISVLLIGPTPTFPFSVPLCVARRSLDSCSTGAHRLQSERWLEMVASRTGAHVWSPFSAFCDTIRCYPTRNGQVAFRDQDHLSKAGAIFAENQLAEKLSWLLERNARSAQGSGSD